MSRLSALNSMLASIGEQPVSSPDSLHPSAITARVVLDAADAQLQSKGWWFNTDHGLNLVPSMTGEIILPSGTLRVDPRCSNSPLVQRGNKLYDPVLHTYAIGASVIVDLVTQVPFNDLPVQAAEAIRALAVYRFYVNDDGDDGKSDRYYREYKAAEAVLKDEQLRCSDVNAMYRPAVRQLLYRVQPGYSGAGMIRNFGRY